MASNQQKIETLYRRYPDLPWSSYEENAVDEGYEVDSPKYYKEVLSQAENDISNKTSQTTARRHTWG